MSLRFDLNPNGMPFFYNSKYFKDIIVPGNRSIISSFLIQMVSEVGRHFSEEISGSGSHQHKGIKKIIKEINRKSGIEVSTREVKTLFHSKTVKRLFSGEKYEKIYFPFRSALILGILIDILDSDIEIKNSYTGGKRAGNIDSLIPDFFQLFKAYVNRIENQLYLSKVSLSSLERHKEKCCSVLTDLTKLNN